MVDELVFVKNTFLQYAGTSLYMLLFFACFLYLPFKAEKQTKTMLFYPLLLILTLIVLNPLMIWFWGIIRMDQTVFWRTYWLLLMVEVMAYVAVCLVFRCKTKVKRAFVAGAFICIIALCGSFMFTPQNYTIAQNLYKLQPETIAVADLLLEEELDENRVSLPAEIVAEIHQYDARLYLTFGREIIYAGTVSIGNTRYRECANILYDMLYRGTLPFSEEELQNALNETNTAVIVQRKDSPTIAPLNETAFLNLYQETEEHYIYQYV